MSFQVKHSASSSSDHTHLFHRIEHEPRYSPDGTRIAFASDRSGTMEIWVAKSDGSNAVPLTSFGGSYYLASPRWSPDGRLIAFAADIGGHPETYVINPDGGTPHRQAIDIADWSRDGKWVYFSSTRTGSQQLWKMRWTNNNQEQPALQLTKNGFNGSATESPDRR